jgi:hypothetical protein
MESSARAAKPAKKKSSWLTWFLIGLGVGIVGTIFVPDLVRPYLPGALRGEGQEVAGIVEAKSREPERLLLTIGGEAGAVLVTYTKQVPEIDLLVEPGDSVVLAVREYAPFVENPSLRRVQKAEEFGRTVRRARPAAEDTGAGAVQRRPRPAAEPDAGADEESPPVAAGTEDTVPPTPDWIDSAPPGPDRAESDTTGIG